MRKTINFNKGWKFIQKNIDPSNYKNEKFKNINIPHVWNNLDNQEEYKGCCWYFKKIGKIDYKADEVVYLEFEGVNSICDIYLNDKKIYHHEGGFSTFRVRIDQYLGVANNLLVKVDNSNNERIYPQNVDFYLFGGIYRNVNLIITNKTHFDLDYYGSPAVIVTPSLKDNRANILIEAYITNYNDEDINIDIYEDGEIIYTAKINSLTHEFVIENPRLWNGIKDPHLYVMNIIIIKNDRILDDKTIKFGIREFEFSPQEGFILNKEPYPLRGVIRHQDKYMLGWAISDIDHEQDIKLIKELGANSLNLANYQHDQYIYDLCDKLGLILIAGIPYINEHKINANDNAINQIKELIIQNYNHPSIVTWVISNDINITEESNDSLKFNIELNDFVHQVDKTRPTAISLRALDNIDSPMNQISDIVFYNYNDFNNHEKNYEWIDNIHNTFLNKAIGISGYGYDKNPAKNDSIECQYYYNKMLEMLKLRPWIFASYAVSMFDYYNMELDICNKGLVSSNRKIKKDSFYLHQAYWSTRPMLHIANKEYIYHDKDIANVIVYSNNTEVSLYVNNKLLDTKIGYKVFEFEVKLGKGKNKLKAVANGLIDNSYIIKIEE